MNPKSSAGQGGRRGLGTCQGNTDQLPLGEREGTGTEDRFLVDTSYNKLKTSCGGEAGGSGGGLPERCC